MSITKKTILFLVSLFASLMLLSAISLIINPIVQNLSFNIIMNIIYPILYSITLLFFIIIQALIRYFMNINVLKKNTSLLSVGIHKFSFREKLWLYLLIAVIYFVPLLNGVILDYTFIIRILMFLLALIIIESLLIFSNKNLNINFLDSGILITGFDSRIVIPFGHNVLISNDSGFYNYYDIDNYFIYPDKVVLFLRNEQGTLSFKANEEVKRQVKGIMVQKEVKMKKFS